MYSMDDLSTKLNISKQSIYKLINKNQELSTLINEHSTREKRKIFYDDAVLNWLSRYYRHNGADETNQGVSNGVVAQNFETASAKIPEHSAQVAELEAKVEELSARLRAYEEENKELRKQNGALILTIQQMTNTAFQQYQASVKMLPAPRKPLLQRLKAVFSGKGRDEAPTDGNTPESQE